MDTQADAQAITSPGKGQDLLPPCHPVFPDRVNIRTACRVPESRLVKLTGFRGDVNADGEVYGEAGRDHNLYVRSGSNGTLVSGSLRNWAGAEGIVSSDGPFDPDEAGVALDTLDDRLGLPAGTLREARLTMVEGALDITVPRPVALYVSACEDLPRTTPFRAGHTTVYFQADESVTKLYDKPAERRSARRSLQDTCGAAHVARIEHTLKSGGVPRIFRQYKDGGSVRAGVLADAQFRDDLAALVVRKARSLQFARTVHPDRPPTSPADREKWYAVRGIAAAGGIDAALLGARADAEPERFSTSTAAKAYLKAHQKALRKLYRAPAYSAVSDLAAEFAASIDAAVGAASL